jgi:small subunit ribosomal protein S16e
VAVATVRHGKGLLKINGCPLDTLLPETMRSKIEEPLFLLGAKKFANLDIRIRVRGGGYTS